MSKKTVSYTLDTLPPLSEAQRRHLNDLATLPDNQIDLTDTPELTDTQLEEMKLAAHDRSQ